MDEPTYSHAVDGNSEASYLSYANPIIFLARKNLDYKDYKAKHCIMSSLIYPTFLPFGVGGNYDTAIVNVPQSK